MGTHAWARPGKYTAEDCCMVAVSCIERAHKEMSGWTGQKSRGLRVQETGTFGFVQNFRGQYALRDHVQNIWCSPLFCHYMRPVEFGKAKGEFESYILKSIRYFSSIEVSAWRTIFTCFCLYTFMIAEFAICMVSCSGNCLKCMQLVYHPYPSRCLCVGTRQLE